MAGSVRRVVAALCVVAGVLSGASSSAFAQERAAFTDVPSNHQFESDISWLVAQGFTSGYADGTFRPAANVSRQSMAAFLYRYAHPNTAKAPSCSASAFSDVARNHPFCGEIAWLSSQDITSGYDDGRFRPDQPVTRQAMAAFLQRFAAGTEGVVPCASGRFVDVTSKHPFCKEISWLSGAGIAGGFADGTFRGGAPVTRQAMAAFLHRLAGIPGQAPGVLTTIAAGNDHACGIRTGGAITCWGSNANGRATPPSGSFTSITANAHTCGVRVNGAVTCWGPNGYGKASAPNGAFTDVAAGYDHTCGLRTNGTLACWGSNNFNQSTPPAGSFKALATGQFHNCALRTNDTVACWGSNGYDQATAPTGTFKAVSVGHYHSCGLRTNGQAECWGAGSHGLGNEPTGSFTALAAGGNYFACGLRSNGSVVCWGSNSANQTTAPAGTFRSIHAGYQFTCGIRPNGLPACWGLNSHGQTRLP